MTTFTLGKTHADTPQCSSCTLRGTVAKKFPLSENRNPFFHCSHLILPWLTPAELVNASLTCKFLFEISKTIIRYRSFDASRSFENLPIPFHNPVDKIPYAYFIYTPSQIISSFCSRSLQRQFWGWIQLGLENAYGSALDPRTPHLDLERSQLVAEQKSKLDPDSVPTLLHKTDNRSESEATDVIDNLGAKFTEQSQFGNELVSRLGADSVNRVDDLDESESGCECEKCLQVGHGNELFGCPCYAGSEEMGIVSECGSDCKCGPECENRFSQGGISVRLKIVRDVKKGWCLFAEQLIPKGKFICEYAGELLTTKEARERQLIYDELAPLGRISSALLVVREHLPSGKACLRMNIDATRIGNIARFINHSCDGGNLSTVLVRNSGAFLPRLCFFASKDIEEGEELTFSYGEIRVRSKGLPCFCGSSCCFGTLPSEHT